MLNNDQKLLSPLFARLFIPFGLGYFISILLGSANAIMSSTLVKTFGLSPADLGFMTSVYLITFGAAQIPIGIFLDRYGARRTLAPALLFSVFGALVFSFAKNIEHLVLSRALLGIGMSGCLMAAFKVYAEWLPSERLPLVYSLQCLTGGIGGMVATQPVAFLFRLLDWRISFVLFAFAVLFIASLIWFVVPRESSSASYAKIPLSQLLREMIAFAGEGRFWAVAMMASLAQGIAFCYIYLWIGPWMRDVAMLDEVKTGECMMYVFAGAALGYFLNGLLADWLKKYGRMSWEQLYFYSSALNAAGLIFIAANNGYASVFVWPIVIFLSSMSMISFPIMRTLYSGEKVGRALSLMNLVVFVLSFIMQWFVGVVLNFYPVTGANFSPVGYKVGLSVLAAINLAAVAWSYFAMKRRALL